MKPKLDNKTIFIGTLIAAVLVVVITLFFYAFWYVKEVKVIEMSAEVNDHIGFDTNSSSLTFGMVMPGTESVRTIMLSHDRNYPLRVSVRRYGEMAEWVFVSDNNFEIKPEQTVALNIRTRPPLGTIYGNYTGTLKIVFTR